MPDANFAPFLDRNAHFAESAAWETVPEIPFIPSKQVYVITCIDPRVEPAAILGVELGEAIVARNVGGRVTPSVIRDLAWILHLHENLTPDADWFEIAVIHHTDCGSGLLADDELRSGYITRGGWDDRETSGLAVLDPGRTVVEDIATLRGAPALAPTIADVRIGGYRYDVETGRLATVVEPG